jgi:hypothetical protein
MTSPLLQPVPQPLKVFLSYSHQDEALKNELIDHLATLLLPLPEKALILS